MMASIYGLKRFAAKPWYPLMTGGLAFADLFFSVIPTDIFVVTAVVAQPRKWLFVALFTAVMSSLGSLSAAAVCSYIGEPALQHYLPSVVQSSWWTWSQGYVTKYGVWALIVFASGPLPLQPGVLIAGLMHYNLGLVFASVLVGRILKYLVECYLAAKFPRYLDVLFPEQKKEAEAAMDLEKSGDPKAL